MLASRLRRQRVRRGRSRPEPGETPDQRLPKWPGVAAAAPERGLDKGLVVEPCRQDPPQKLERRQQVEAGAWHPVHRPGLQPLDQRHRRRQRVRLLDRAEHMHEGVRFFWPGRHDAARPVQLEAAADHVDAIGEQRRSQRVARVAMEASAIEAEAEPPRAVDGAAGEPRGAHAPPPGTRSVAVSRVSRNQARQPATCCHHSGDTPFGLSKP